MTRLMEAVREDIFGSAACVLPFETEDEATSKYGLAGGVFTCDQYRNLRMATTLKVGSASANTYNMGLVEVSFGGFRQSRIWRENGTAAIEIYSQMKTVYVKVNQVDFGTLNR